MVPADNKTQEYVGRFNLWKRKTALSYIEMAKVIVEAKETLTRERFTDFTQMIGYGPNDSFISKLYRIGLQADLFEQNIDCLPSSFTTLYALTTIDKCELVSLFEAKQIRTSLKGKEIDGLVKLNKRYKPAKSCYPQRRSGPVEYIDIDTPIQRQEPIAVNVDRSMTKASLAQFLRQLELLTKIEGITVSIPGEIRNRLESEEVV